MSLIVISCICELSRCFLCNFPHTQRFKDTNNAEEKAAEIFKKKGSGIYT